MGQGISILKMAQVILMFNQGQKTLPQEGFHYHERKKRLHTFALSTWTITYLIKLFPLFLQKWFIEEFFILQTRQNLSPMSTQCREEIDVNKQTMCCGNNITAIGYTTIIEGRCYEHTHVELPCDRGCLWKLSQRREHQSDRPLHMDTISNFNYHKYSCNKHLCRLTFHFSVLPPSSSFG